MVLAVAGHFFFTVPDALSTFATPAIGAAYLAGNRDVKFATAATVIVVTGLLLAIIGNLILSAAIWRSGTQSWATLLTPWRSTACT
jgi:hypothetical protein